jgi:hypothetical protein
MAMIDAAARQADDADRFSVAQKRHANHRAMLSELRVFLPFIQRIVPGIVYPHRPTRHGDAADERARTG